MEQLTGMDASFLYFETPHAPMHIGSFTIYDPSTAPGGFVRFKDVLSHVESRLRELRTTGTVPRTRFNANITAHRVVDGRSFSLADVRAIKSAVDGATVNDAVLTIVGGALHKYLKHHGELPGDPLVAMAPISVRDPSQRGSAGNQVAAMMVGLRTNIEDPLERLQAVHEGAVASKALTNAVGARNLADYSRFIPSQLAGLAARLSTSAEMRALTERAAPAINTVVTNVPGPQTPLYFAGAEALNFVGLGPVYDGMALIHPVFSYCGRLAISFTSCRETLPDPERYADMLQASFAELQAAAGRAGPAGKSPSAADTRPAVA